MKNAIAGTSNFFLQDGSLSVDVCVSYQIDSIDMNIVTSKGRHQMDTNVGTLRGEENKARWIKNMNQS